MELTQEEFQLWTKQAVTFSDEEWSEIVGLANARLASFLCLEELPPDSALALPLAWLIRFTLDFESEDSKISSKRIRNFSVSFRGQEAANAFKKIADEFGDILDSYSNCGLAFSVERSACRRCNGCF